VYLVHNARRTLLVAALALAAVACKDDDPDRPPRPDTLPDTTAIGTPGEVTVTLFGGTAAPNLAPLAFAPKKDVIVRATTVANQYTLAWGAAANATSYRLTVTADAFGAGTVGGLPSNATVNATTYTFTAVPPAAWESLAYTATVIGARGTRVGPSRTVTWKVVRPAPGQPGPISVDSSLAAAFLKAAPLDSVTIVQMASGETCRGEYAAIMSATFVRSRRARPPAPRSSRARPNGATSTVRRSPMSPLSVSPRRCMRRGGTAGSFSRCRATSARTCRAPSSIPGCRASNLDPTP
jgi:hypothetical protein